ncbi:hypothetical protein [Actinomadura sp. 6N118]|uniref:hypothetical protein n=1 Tax=Actinomadura sp. 6N118 TaxID=3375151 RepID=UPI0037938780
MTDSTEKTTTKTVTTSEQQISRHLARHRALYAPSVVAEAAAFLDDLLAVADRHGVDPTAEAAGWLVTAAAESISPRYGRPPVERTVAQVRELTAALDAECDRIGLTRALPAGGRDATTVAVAPAPGGPTWGISPTGLAVRIYTDAGWDLTINQARTPAISIYAPATPDGAREVARMLDRILHGRAPDPFRDHHR